MRGKQASPQSESKSTRITPAGAGKTRLALSSSFRLWDHPRRCGENVFVYALRRVSAGSPPQVRGKPFDLLSIIRKDRITPAGAGKTWNNASKPKHTRDHPRRCGENRLPSVEIMTILGSPPQVRGKRYLSPSSDFGFGITPAGAGKTFCTA